MRETNTEEEERDANPTQTMQGIHHQQQQLATLLSVALPKDDSSSSTSAAVAAAPSEQDDSSRLAALESLHRAILYPPNSFLVTHSASFLAQGFSQLLSDKSYAVRQSAARAFGALCSVVSSISAASNGRQNHVMLSSLVDRFFSWALPLLSHVNAGDKTTELALGGLHEFLNVGDAGAIERYASPILKASQELLEDERTSWSLLHQLLGVLTLLSSKFSRCFQPHFADVVDLLLGWALVPDLAESDRSVIMDSFLQFQKHWVSNMSFSLGLVSKFLGDMDVLLQDASPGTPKQFRRLLALLSCFLTVLQSTASGLLEMNLLEQISEPLSQMLPRLLACLLMVGKKFGWSKWIGDSWRCFTLLAEILREGFCSFYPLTLDILFQSLEMDNTTRPFAAGKINSFQVHGVLKTNLQLLSLQKLGLPPLSVQKILQFDKPISQLRLHPNHLVTGSSAATYIFLLQHGNNEIVEQATTSIIEEIKLLIGMLGKLSGHNDGVSSILDSKAYSKLEVFALIKFDLTVLLSCVSLGGNKSLIGQPDVAALYLKRSKILAALIIDRLNPFDLPVQGCVELQVNIIKTLGKLSAVEFLSKCSIRKQSSQEPSVSIASDELLGEKNFRDGDSYMIIEHLSKCSIFVVKALHLSSPVEVKVQALEWIQSFCEDVISLYDNSDGIINPCSCNACGHVVIVGNLVRAVLDASSDREPKLRAHIAVVLELLLRARLVHPVFLYSITEVVLEKLGDPQMDIRNAFVRLLSVVLPITMHQQGLVDDGAVTAHRTGILWLRNRSYLHWKQVFALKQLPQQLQSQQLVSILSYISQRWKVPLSSWIYRLIQRSRRSTGFPFSEREETGNFSANGSWLNMRIDDDILDKISSVSNLAGAWWAIHEAARYCIATRLRTNLGGPTQTFAALERMLLDTAHLLQLETEQKDGNLNLISPSSAHLLPMRLLLDFVEALKKNVYNAYDGSTVLLSANRQSSLFFRANKKVCEEWFSRICEPMMNAGLALQCHDGVIHYCALRLQELKNLVASALKDRSRTQMSENPQNIRGKFSEDILRVLRHMALAHCKSHDPDALVGLQKWVSKTFSALLGDENQSSGPNEILRPFSWMTGLVYQAQGQYEKAAAHFTHMLQDEESLMGSDFVQFAIARVIESYTAVSDWKSLESWLLELQTLRAKHAGRTYSGALTTAGIEINAIQALAHFDEHDYQAAWACLDLTPKSSCELTLDPKLALQRSEQMLLQAMLFQSEGKVDKVSHEIQKAKSMLEEMLSVLPLDGLREAAAYATQLHCIFAFEEGYSFRCSEEKQKQHHSILSTSIQAVQSSIDNVHQDCSLWLKIFRVYQNMLPSSPVTLKLAKNLSTLARKQGNLGLANRLNDYLGNNVLSCYEGSFRDNLTSNLQYEGILLMHAENNIEDAITNLWNFVHPCIVSSASIVSDVDESILKAKACLKLSKWLRQDLFYTIISENIALKMLADCSITDDASLSRGRMAFTDGNICEKPNVELIVEEIVGTTTKLSTHLCPTMGKAWISYASWCYSQARDSLSSSHENVLRSCSFSSTLVPEILPERFKLSEDEIQRVESVILRLFQRRRDAVNENHEREEQGFWIESVGHLRDEDPVKPMVEQVVNIIEDSAGAAGGENSTGECLSATFTSRLHIFFVNAIVGLREKEVSLLIDDLVDVWWPLRRRRVSLFGHAAYGFIQYLSYSSSKILDAGLVGHDCEPLKQKSGSHTLRATLYVLHILLNFGVELKDTIEPALLTIPLFPWQEVTPQLFARLTSHPEKGVRKELEGILILLAKLSPWSIVYPTLVDVNACEEESYEELQHILGCLSKLYPRLIEDVQLMISELENVTVLWEELWLSTLQDLHTDVMRRINVLKEEAARIAENDTLSHNEKNKINAAKYSAMMAPVFVALERRLASTSRKPETRHEIWFNREYAEQLKSAILTFKVPPATIAALGDVWRPFDNIASSLTNHQRKSSISLEEVAPRLALLSSSDVPMPGLEKQMAMSESDGGLEHNALGGIVRIASFSEQVSILSTKTKPKKLVILGSDGERYTYLLKGREDLRLDARIMQLLQAINGFLHSSPGTRNQCLGIRYYSVTPISGRAGLIQWVDNVISIYSVFKSWQNRAQLAVLGAGSSKNTVPLHVPRPSDMFYGKIIPALKEKGIRRVISRRDWPHEVKRKVLQDLMKEAPRQLLHQELWCASEGFKAFSSKLKRYSGSVAAMSMVGHILGLGDRHLDNILMDFSSGDIVHIDYNVCFDKGQRLKIPEIVPFRLTQTIEAALGLTGVEGTFRANCEAVVGVLRKNKDILLMLLEVFLWDPLVEWTRGDFHDDATIGGEERKGMELAVSLSLFASRVQEIRVPLQEHHDLLSATLPAVASALERFTDVLNQYELVSAHFFHVDQERSNLILHESSAKSIVAEATNKSEKTRASYEIQAREFAQAKAMVAEIAQLATTWMEQHGKILDALRSSSIPEIKACTKLSNTEDAWSLTSAVMVAGVPLTVVPEPTLAQSRDIDREVSQFIAELDHGLSCAVAALEAYSLSLQRILPLNYHTTSPVSGWAQVLQLSANTVSSDMLSIAKGQAAELIAKAHGGDLESIRCSHNDLCLKVERYAVEIKRVEEECAGLMNSIGLETESNSRDRLFSTFANYMQSMGFSRKADAASSIHSRPFKYDEPKGAKSQVEHEEKKERIWSNFNLAASSLYFNVRHRVLDILSNSSKEKHAECSLQTDFGTVFCEFEEQVEKCILIAGIVNEVSQLIGRDSANTDMFPVQYPSESNWASNIKSCLVSCQSLAGQLIGVVLPDIIRSVVSFNSEVMDAFGCLSQIRGSIDTALEQLIDVELERASLIELERNYFVKVALITEQQLALEEAAVKGRDHLSWEDAEELASQEEACKAQLDQLHQSWNQKDLRTSSLIKKEAGIRNALISAERHFKSLTNVEQDTEPHLLRRKVLLSRLIKPFSELESIDKVLPSFCSSTSSGSSGNLNLADLMISGYPMSGFIWKFSSLLNSYCFFIWQVGVVDSILDSCIHDVASFVDQNLGFDQLYNVVKKKLEIQLQEQIGLYLKERVAPALLDWLDKGNEHLKQLAEATKECNPDLVKKDDGAVKQVQHMLEECCNAHETVRAARSAASAMKKQVNELGEALCKTSLEIVQMEWMYDVALNTSHNTRVIFHKFLSSDDDLYPIIVNLSRPKLLEGVRSAVSKIARSVECLQACERTSVTAEGQLERAMGWACGGPNPSASGNQSTKSSGIPPEFHDHLMRRRKMLCDARENASDIMKICMSLLEFEASRDGIFRIPGEIYQVRIGGDGRMWQQACLNALTRLEVTYHSFTGIGHEWKLAHNSMEAASSGLFSATNELSIASAKAKSASGDLQNILLAMRDCAYEVSVALTAFSRVTKVHTALTSECGSMLEEVLAITEGLHDVHSLGKEAAAVHHSLIEDLSKACSILLPLESVLSKDVAAMTDAMARERETKMEISPIHGQAIYQSYSLRIREACQAFTPLVSALTFSVEGLHSMLIRLARTASFHAGNLHKALEGLGESQYGGSPEINLLTTDLAGDAIDFDNKNEEFSNSIGADMEDLPGHMTESSQDKGWISPPDTIYSSSEYSIQSTESSLQDGFSGATEGREQISHVPNVRVKSSRVSWNSEPFSEAGSQEVSYCEDSESTHPEEVNNNDSGTPRTSPSDKSLAAGIETSHPLIEETSGVKLRFRDEASSSNQARVEDGNREAPVLNMDAGRRAARGKNAYAMSVLRRVKMKLDGRDIDNREVSIAEQVDHLLKQATSIDNLCNMYEGWTPWI